MLKKEFFIVEVIFNQNTFGYYDRNQAIIQPETNHTTCINILANAFDKSEVSNGLAQNTVQIVERYCKEHDVPYQNINIKKVDINFKDEQSYLRAKEQSKKLPVRVIGQV